MNVNIKRESEDLLDPQDTSAANSEAKIIFQCLKDKSQFILSLVSTYLKEQQLVYTT